MINSNIIKLVSLVLGGILILFFGFIIQRKILKKKELEEIKMYSNYNNLEDNKNISEKENEARNYILKYKDSYSKDSIKNALINNGNSLEDVERWLDKYF